MSVRYHPDAPPPTWSLPELRVPGGTTVSWTRVQFDGHPLDVTENSIDLGYLSFVHDDALEAATAIGPVLRAHDAMATRRKLCRVTLPPIRTGRAVAVHGPGF